jgi:6-phosphogluconolactonase (cycloisomerase 2 family)
MSNAVIAGRLALALPLCAGIAGCASDIEPPLPGTSSAALGADHDDDLVGGTVYAMTNDADHNAVVRYARHRDGRLEYRDATLTGGRGTGSKVIPALEVDGVDPLTSQHSLTLTADRSVLIASNTGDDTVTSFRVGEHGELSVANRVSSGGRFPNSVAIHRDLVYVANAGDPAHGAAAGVIGFRIDRHGALRRIYGGAGGLGSPASQPTHALFSPDGRRLVVSDVATNQIAVFPIHPDGTLGAATFNASAGTNPFGMIFASRDTLLVSEAQGIVPGAASVSSYQLAGTRLSVISPAVGNGQTAACWLSITPDRRFAYSSNTANSGGAGGFGDISIYAVSPVGALTLIEGAAVPRAPLPGGVSSGPVDSLISADGRYLYQQYSGLGTVGAFAIGDDGRLTPIAGGDGGHLPVLGAEGLDGF